MFRIVFSAILLVVLAVLVVLNLESTTTVNLFGRQFQDVSVVAIGLVAFVAGVVYSFIIYVGNYIARSRRERLSKRERSVKEKEKAEKKQKKDEKGRKALPGAAGAGAQSAGGQGAAGQGAGGQGAAGTSGEGSSDAGGSSAGAGASRPGGADAATGGKTGASPKKKSGGLFSRLKR